MADAPRDYAGTVQPVRADIANNDRVRFYIRPYEYTGSQAALTLSQISSGSDFVSGITWGVNNQIRNLFPDRYPAGGVPAFSNEIARNEHQPDPAESRGIFAAPEALRVACERVYRVYSSHTSRRSSRVKG